MRDTTLLCKDCAELLTTPDNVAKLTGLVEPLLEVRRVYSDLLYSANNGCPTCQLFLPKNDTTTFTNDTEFYITLAGMRQDYSRRGVRNRCLDFNEICSHRSVTSGKGLGGKGFYDSDASSRWWVSVQRDSPLAASLNARPILRDFDCEYSFQVMRNSLDACVESHKDCPKPCRAELPARVIDVDDSRLIESHGRLGYYTTLSYCWGMQTQPVMLTKVTAHELSLAIPVNKLALTIRDAIKVTKELGIKYLWVDSMCIIQDDPIDKSEQISNLKDIFRHSYLTICAARVKQCTSGFLDSETKGISRKGDFEDFRMPYVDPSGVSGHLIVQPPYFEVHEPIADRAWTLEERLLSTRMLTFNTGSVTTDCSLGHYILEGKAGWEESAFLTPTWYATNLTYASEFDVQLKDISLGADIDMASASEARNLRMVWPVLVEEYTMRDITHGNDRLRAIAGLASRFQSVYTSCTYRAGLWDGISTNGKNFLLTQLLWLETGYRRNFFRTHVGIEGNDRTLPVDPLTPSWSWASVCTAVAWSSFGVALVGMPLTTFSPSEPEKSDPGDIVACVSQGCSHGQSSGPQLILKGPFRRTTAQVVICEFSNMREITLDLEEGAEGADYICPVLDPGLINIEIDGLCAHSFATPQDMSLLRTRQDQIAGEVIEVGLILLKKRHGLVLAITANGSWKRIGVFELEWHEDCDAEGADGEPSLYTQTMRNAFFGSRIDTITII